MLSRICCQWARGPSGIIQSSLTAPQICAVATVLCTHTTLRLLSHHHTARWLCPLCAPCYCCCQRLCLLTGIVQIHRQVVQACIHVVIVTHLFLCLRGYEQHRLLHIRGVCCLTEMLVPQAFVLGDHRKVSSLPDQQSQRCSRCLYIHILREVSAFPYCQSQTVERVCDFTRTSAVMQEQPTEMLGTLH